MSSHDTIYKFVQSAIIEICDKYESASPHSQEAQDLYNAIKDAAQTLHDFSIEHWANCSIDNFIDKLRIYALVKFASYDPSDTEFHHLVSLFTNAIFVHELISAANAFQGLVSTHKYGNLSIGDQIRISSLAQDQFAQIITTYR